MRMAKSGDQTQQYLCQSAIVRRTGESGAEGDTEPPETRDSSGDAIIRVMSRHNCKSVTKTENTHHLASSCTLVWCGPCNSSSDNESVACLFGARRGKGS